MLLHIKWFLLTNGIGMPCSVTMKYRDFMSSVLNTTMKHSLGIKEGFAI